MTTNSMYSEGDLERILTIVEENDVGVVFVDTLRAVAGGMEENKAEEVRMFFNSFKLLKDKGVCVVFLDHLRKASDGRKGEPQKEHLFASQDKTASSEILLILRKQPGDSTITMYQRKNRLGEEMRPFDIWIHDTDINSKNNQTILEYGGEHNGFEKKFDTAKELILESLAIKGLTRKELIEIVGDETGASERTIQSALKELHKNQQVDVKTVQRQHHYSIPTPKTPETGVLIKE